MGMGALCYEPVNSISNSFPLPDFDDLQQMALDVLSEKDDSSADLLYFNSGNSGGCRPKCLYHDEEGSWIVKFRHTYDPKDMGKMEFEFNRKARRCGVEVPDFKLIDGKYEFNDKGLLTVNSISQTKNYAKYGEKNDNTIEFIDYTSIFPITDQTIAAHLHRYKNVILLKMLYYLLIIFLNNKDILFDYL